MFVTFIIIIIFRGFGNSSRYSCFHLGSCIQEFFKLTNSQAFFHLYENIQNFPIRNWETGITFLICYELSQCHCDGGFTVIQRKEAGYALSTATCAFTEQELLSCLLCTLSNSEADNGKHIFSSKLRSSNKLDKNTCDGSNNVWSLMLKGKNWCSSSTS